MTAARSPTRPSHTAILEALPGALLTLDPAWRVSYLNLAAARFLGAAPAELLGRELWSVCPELSGSPLEGSLRRAMLSGTGDQPSKHLPNHLEVAWPGRAGWLELHSFALEGGLGLHFRDVPEPAGPGALLEGFTRLARELALETDAGALLERAQAIVLPLLPPGCALYFEPQGDRWRLRAQRGPLPAGAAEQLAAGLPFAQAGFLLSAWQSGQPHYQTAASAGPLFVSGFPSGATAALPLPVNGEPRGVFAVVLAGPHGWSAAEQALLENAAFSLRLALERAHSAAEQAEQQARLQEANDELEAFAYSASHDLRTPVRHIQGFADLLRRELGDQTPEKTARLLGVIESAAVRMSTLIDELLAFSRLGRQALSVEQVDLSALFEEVRRELESEWSGRVVHWQLMPLPVVCGDAGLLRQVIQNLLSNALKYSGTQPEARISVSARRLGGEHIVQVQDNGVGFDARYQARLFGVFQRLHRESEFAGTGVGLANVRRIVQKHGGRVWAESELGHGATFSFSLPV